MPGRLATLTLLVALLALPAAAATLHPNLEAQLAGTAADEELPVLIHMADKLDLSPYRGRATAGAMIRDLRAHAASTQAASSASSGLTTSRTKGESGM